MPLDLCTISGILYKPSGAIAGGTKVYVVRAEKSGTVIIQGRIEVDESDSITGAVSFTVPRASTVWLSGFFLVGGTDFNENDGVALTIPDASTATLESLGAAADWSPEGAVVKSNGTAFAGRFGTFDFSSAFVVTESPTGEANVDLASSTESVQDTVGAMVPAALLTYNDVPGTLTLTPQAANRIFSGPATGVDAIPTWRALVAADIPSLTAAKISDFTAAVLLVAPAPAWGGITGTLSAQTDLQTALNAKQDSLGFTAVPNTRTVNGHALSANITVTKSDVGLGSVDDTSDASKPVSTAQQTALDLKADLASPSLSGTPTAPTASAATNTTQIATTAFVRTEVANLVGTVPSTLDTLDELAQALGDDPNFATTIATALGLKADTSSLAAIALSGSASDLSAGTIPDARFPATLPAASGVNLTALNASNIASGILATARGGTGIEFFTAAGPTQARVYTFPDAAATIARTDAANAFIGNQTIAVGQTTSAQTDLLVNPTTKASGKLIDLQVNSASKFSVAADGTVAVPVSGLGYTSTDASLTGYCFSAVNTPAIYSGGSQVATFSSTASATAAGITVVNKVTSSGFITSSGAFNAQTGTTYTLVAADNGKTVTMTNASAITLTVPSGLGAGFSCTIVQLGAGQVTVTGSGATVSSFGSLATLAGQYASASLFAPTANAFILAGTLG